MPQTDLLTIMAWGAMCNVWSVLLWMQSRIRRDGTLVSANIDEDVQRNVDVCVVIPACNEQAGIAACLASVQAQDLSGLRIVVVDDRSDDDTAEVVRGVAKADPQLALCQVETLPKGWLGKSHALAQATEGLDADWFLFIDADCRLLSPYTIRAAVDEAYRRDAALLTLLPAQATGGFAEGMLIPLCSAVMALWYGRSNRPQAAGFANGQFLLIRRKVYQAVGGHTAVRRAIIEDVPLAEAVRAAGYTTWAGGGAELVSVRMYNSLSSTFRGWSRIFVGALRSPIKIVLSIAWLMAGSLWPFLALPWLIHGWLTLEGETPASLIPLTSLCVSHLLLLAVVSYGFWGLGRCDRRYLWLYPLSVLGVIAILGHAFWTMAVSRRMGWRTTSYRFDRRAMILDPVSLDEAQS